jgi:hypothetical protein
MTTTPEIIDNNNDEESQGQVMPFAVRLQGQGKRGQILKSRNAKGAHRGVAGLLQTPMPLFEGCREDVARLAFSRRR